MAKWKRSEASKISANSVDCLGFISVPLSTYGFSAVPSVPIVCTEKDLLVELVENCELQTPNSNQHEVGLCTTCHSFKTSSWISIPSFENALTIGNIVLNVTKLRLKKILLVAIAPSFITVVPNAETSLRKNTRETVGYWLDFVARTATFNLPTWL